MASAITKQALTGKLARGRVYGHRVQPGKESCDSFLLAAPHPGADLRAADRRVAKGFAGRCLCGYPAAGLRVATQDLDKHVGVENHPTSRSTRLPRRTRLTYVSVGPRSDRAFHTPKAPARSASRKSSFGVIA